MFHEILVGEPECQRQFGRTRYRWEFNVKKDLTEIGREGVDWIQLGQGPVAVSREHGSDSAI